MFFKRHKHRNKCIKVDHYNDTSWGDRAASTNATWVCIDCGHLSESIHYGMGWITVNEFNKELLYLKEIKDNKDEY